MKYYMKHFKVINLFSCVITILFIAVLFTVGGFFTENLLGVPLYGLFIIWSQSVVPLIDPSELKQAAKERFACDIFLISYSFYLSSLIGLLILHNNQEAMGWWLFIVYFVALVGLGFALIFSTLALCLGSHKIYTLVFSVVILVAFLIKYLFPWTIPVPFKYHYVAAWIDIIGLLFLHVMVCFIYLLRRFISHR